jgi:hypothetical protein
MGNPGVTLRTAEIPGAVRLTGDPAFHNLTGSMRTPPLAACRQLAPAVPARPCQRAVPARLWEESCGLQTMSDRGADMAQQNGNLIAAYGHFYHESKYPAAVSEDAESITAQMRSAVSEDAEPPAGHQPAARAGLRSAARVAVFDVVGPLVVYSALRSTGMSAVPALVLSGVLPAIGVTINALQRRRLEVIGTLVLAGIAVGTILGLVSHNARLVLLEGSVPTAAFGLACLGSLCTPKPLLFGSALEFVGPESTRGREMTRLWQREGYRHAYRVVTAVWGAGYLAEAAVRVVIVENTSTGTALVASKLLPYAGAAILAGWTVAYRRYQWRKA